MKVTKLFPSERYRIGRMRFVLLFFISLLGTLLGGELLFRDSVVVGISSIIINIGLDPQRTTLVVALLMTAGAALIGALLGRRKAGAVLGAGIVFWFGYLANFIRIELQPLRDPGGLLEPLVRGALVNTSVTMMALALLVAFIGSAVGIALAEVLLDPFYDLLYGTWRLFMRRRLARQTTAPVAVNGGETTAIARVDRIFKLIGQWLGVFVVVGLLFLASASGDLFTFGPDVGLHTVPVVHALAPGLPTHGTIVSNTLVSVALKGQRKPFLVYLPPSYNTPQGQKKHYPVLYLLHGSPGKDIDWIKGGKAVESADTLIDTGTIQEMIMVFPDGNGRPGATSEWADSFDHRQLIETYVMRDLVHYVDQHYRTIPDAAHRAIGGLSMGGFGAMNIAVHHPDVFGSIISLGGYYRAEGTIWGHNAAYMQKNSPADTLPGNKAAWKLHIYLGAATKDQPYYKDTLSFMRELNALHIAYHFDLERGYHSWRIWQVQMYNAMRWLKW